MLELFKSIKLDKEIKEALYLQLYRILRDFISEGTLVPDFRLPSVRQLSSSLGVNQVTVVSAFRELETHGLVHSKPGSGTFVSRALPHVQSSQFSQDGIISDELYNQEDVGVIIGNHIKIDGSTVNFASATPSPDLFPVEDFKAALDEVLQRDKGNAFGYQDSQGFNPLRQSFSRLYLEGSFHPAPEDIQVISGAQQGIDIISKALLRQGDYVVAESPTYTGAIAVFKSRGAEIIDIGLSENGPDINVFEYVLKKYKPKLFYTIPSFQNPTGYSCPNNKRREILKLAEKYNVFVIEDDYVSDLDYEAKGLKALKSLDNSGRVIYIKSFSKIFMPGLRIGFMITPQSLQRNILEAKHTTDISTSGLLQRAFDLYIRKGFWQKHFEFMYAIYKERYYTAIRALEINKPDFVSYCKPGGGLNLWLELPAGFPVMSLLKNTAANGIVFAPGKIFYSSTYQGNNNIRLSFAAVNTDNIYSGISKLCSIIRSLSSGKGSHENLPIL